MTAEQYDIVISGGGLVGTTLALALARLPLTVCLVDPVAKAPPRPIHDRTFTIAQGSKRALAALGVWGRLGAADFQPIQEIEVSDRAGRFGLTHIRAAEQGVDALGFVTANGALLEALYDALAATDIPVRAGRFTGLQKEGATVGVSVSAGGATVQLSARLLVGADGTHSAVRAACGVPVTVHDYERVAIVSNCRVTAPRPTTAFERFTEHGPIAALPMGDDRYTFVVSRPPTESWQERDDDAFLSGLEQAFGDRLGHLVAASPRLKFPLIRQQAGAATDARVLLVGNAAHTLHPVAGQGFNLGLRDVAVLADRLADACRRGLDFGDPAWLAGFHEARRSDIANTTRFTDGLVRLFSGGPRPLVVARSLALTLIDCLPAVKRALGIRTMGLKGPLPRLLRGLTP